jgi:D-3-phosphoglycerate dehydrogenase
MLIRTAMLGRANNPSPLSLVRTQPRALKSALFDVPLDLDHGSEHAPGEFRIQTFNKISASGLSRFPHDLYTVSGDAGDQPHAILLRSHKLSMNEVPHSVRAVARCGAGTNNVPVAEMTAAGIPVFNTPGANANAVKELVLAGIFLASRDIIGGIGHMKKLGADGLARERVETDKALFGGREIAGKTLGVIGLGHIGSATARDATMLGMKVCGYDPGMSIQSALKLPGNFKPLSGMKAVFEQADYISLNIPFINKPPEEGGTKGIINEKLLSCLKPDAVLLNFARGELVDSKALKAWMNSPAGATGKYVTDFPEDELWEHERTIVIPHLGASTEEAEDAAAAMAADTVMKFLATGEIVNSVNFPETILQARDKATVRVGVVNTNTPNVLANVLAVFGDEGINILQQVNKSRGDIAYNVIDVEHNDSVDWAEVQKRLTTVEHVISSRFILGETPLGGYGYAKNLPDRGYIV